MIRAALLAAAFLPLTACGFSPVYGGGPGGSFASSGPIQVSEIRAIASSGAAPGRTGHFLRQELVRSIGQGVPGFSSGVLDVSLRQGIERLAFAPDQAASRSDYVGSATWTLRGADGGILGTGSVQERASFNFANAAYADLAAQTAAQERLATLLARSIRAEMIMAAGKPVNPKTGRPIEEQPATPPAPAAAPATGTQ
jgi:LPS-assembly lipoprotein